ncbi:MAG: SMP-30/gluconolactonase/LRE family protein [Woeseiaceae bacterium]|nr:SMP-30/gluconolactonase/LRE family protein [Woeseiaceae bacterium]
MKSVLVGSSLALLLIALYLLLWPVPVEPVAWQAPVDRGIAEPFGPDSQLQYVRTISTGDYEGPEDLSFGWDGHLYSTTSSGAILRISPSGRVTPFVDVGGRPLGLTLGPDGNLYVANAYIGLQRVDSDGNVENLLTEVDGEPLVYANNVAVASDGRVFFSESSRKFQPKAFGGTYASSLLDIMEHGGHGRVIEYDPADDSVRVIAEGLNYANGVAVSDDDRFLLIAETGAYRIHRHWLAGPQAGETEVILDNLPAFPDNITAGMQGRFWVGLIAPRVGALDELSDKPALRKVVQRLPAALRPKAVPYSHVIAVNGDGEVLMNLRDPAARLPSLTAVLETPDALYLATLFGHRLGRLDKRDLL